MKVGDANTTWTGRIPDLHLSRQREFGITQTRRKKGLLCSIFGRDAPKNRTQHPLFEYRVSYPEFTLDSFIKLDDCHPEAFFNLHTARPGQEHHVVIHNHLAANPAEQFLVIQFDLPELNRPMR